MVMKICVDRDLCEANAICMGCAPEVFRVEDDDTLTLLIDEIPDGLMPAVEDAVRLCPRQALSLE
jgi:ferredoxin